MAVPWLTGLDSKSDLLLLYQSSVPDPMEPSILAFLRPKLCGLQWD